MNIYDTLYDFLHSLYYRHCDLVSIADFNEYLERPEIREALYMNMEHLMILQNRQWKPMNACKRWSIKEDEKLAHAYKRGVTINSLAAIHQRTEVAIVKRLNKLGKVLFGDS